MIVQLKIRRLLVVLLVVSGILAGFFGLWTHYQLDRVDVVQQDKMQMLVSGFQFPVAKKVAPFSLQRTDGVILDNAALKGHFSVVFFGFTHCPEMCPTTLSALGRAYRLLERDGHTVLPEVLFVTVDPERDTLAVIKHYLSGFHSNFVGVAGDEQHLLPLQKSLGVLVMSTPVKGHGDMVGMSSGSGAKAHQHVMKAGVSKSGGGASKYGGEVAIDHSGGIMVINPEGQFVAFLSPPHEPDSLAHDIRKVIDNYYHPELKSDD